MVIYVLCLFILMSFNFIILIKEVAMSIYDYTVKDAEGNDISLKDYEGKVLLIVNTATK